MEYSTDIIITVISTIIGTLLVEALIWLITKIYRKASFKIKRSKQRKRLVKQERAMKKTKKYKIALRLEATGLLYQRGVVRCSEERIGNIKARSLIHGFTRVLLPDLFSKDELLECSEEVSYECWEESEFDFILDI